MICQVYSAAVLMPASKALSPTIGLRSTIGSPSDVLAFRLQNTRPPTLPIATYLFTTTQAHPVGLGRYGLSEAFAHGFVSRLGGATGMGNWANPRSVELRNRNVRGEWRRFLMQPFRHRKD